MPQSSISSLIVPAVFRFVVNHEKGEIVGKKSLKSYRMDRNVILAVCSLFILISFDSGQKLSYI